MRPVAISISAFCATYGIGKTKTYELINSGDLEVVKLGRRTLVIVRSADALFGIASETTDFA